jgi:hypothetical protein
VSEYLAELYAPRADAAAVERDAERSRRAAQELTREGTPVRHLRWMFAPDDETCFFLYEATSADAVHEVARRAALTFEHIAQAVEG